MSREITSAEELLTEMAAEADKLGLHYSNNPDSLTEPVDAIDALCDALDPEKGERALHKETPPQEEIPHEITDTDDQPEDPEEMEMAKDTLDYFQEFEFHGPKKQFESEFRAFLHCEDYSYSAKTIRHLIASVLGLD